jgi:hypothetical protein
MAGLDGFKLQPPLEVSLAGHKGVGQPQVTVSTG